MKRKVRGHIVIRRIWDDETKVYWKPRADASFLKVGNLRETTFAAFFSQEIFRKGDVLGSATPPLRRLVAANANASRAEPSLSAKPFPPSFLRLTFLPALRSP